MVVTVISDYKYCADFFAVMNAKCDCSTSYFFPHRKMNCTLEKLMKTAGIISTPRPSDSCVQNSEAPIGITSMDASEQVTEKPPAVPVGPNLEEKADDSQNDVSCGDDQLGMALGLASSRLDDPESVCEAWVVVSDDDTQTPTETETETRVYENEDQVTTDAAIAMDDNAVEVASQKGDEKCSDGQKSKKVIDVVEKFSKTDTAKICQVICLRKEDTATQPISSTISQIAPLQRKVVEDATGSSDMKSIGGRGHVITEATQDATCIERKHDSKSESMSGNTSSHKVTTSGEDAAGQIKVIAIKNFPENENENEIEEKRGATLDIATFALESEISEISNVQETANIEIMECKERKDEGGKEGIEKEIINMGRVKETDKEEDKEVEKKKEEGVNKDGVKAALSSISTSVSAASIKEETSLFLDSHTSTSTGTTREMSGEEKALQSMCTCSTAALFPHRLGKCAAKILASGLKGKVDNCMQYIGDLDNKDRVAEDVR